MRNENRVKERGKGKKRKEKREVVRETMRKERWRGEGGTEREREKWGPGPRDVKALRK